MGGGMAAFNGMRTGLPTTTFNAAGVHPNTLRSAGVGGRSQDHITNHSSPGDFLTNMQEGGVTAPIMPDALGKQRMVIPRDENGRPMDDSDGGLDHHGMEGMLRGLRDSGSTTRQRGAGR